MHRSSRSIRRDGVVAGGLLVAAIALGGCMRENVCYEPETMPEYGKILRAVPCDRAKETPGY